MDKNNGMTAVTKKAGDDLRIRAMQYVRDEIIKQRDSLQSSLVMIPADRVIEDQKSVDNDVVSHSDSTEQMDQTTSKSTTSSTAKRKKKGKKQSKDDDDDAALEEAMALNAHHQLQQQEQGGSLTTASTGKMSPTRSRSDRLPEPFRQAIMVSCRILLQVQDSS